LYSSADRCYMTRTGGVGSVGVYMLHVDQSKFNEKLGVKPTFIHAGAKKVLGNPHEPLSEEAQSEFQSEVDKVYSLFCLTVARNRGMSEEAVRATEAACLWGEDGVKAGLADKVGTLKDAIADMRAAVEQDPAQKSFSMAASAANPRKGASSMDETKPADATEETTADATTEEKPEQEAKPPCEDGKDKTESEKSEKDDEEEDDKENPMMSGEQTAAAATTEQLIAAARKAGRAEAAQITSLCRRCGKGSLAEKFIADGLSMQEVKDKLLESFAVDSDATEVNGNHAATTSNNPVADLDARAKAMAKEQGISKEQAMARMFKADPSLYQQYLAANPAQTGRQ
jgi:ClpP class serine protease